MSGAASDVIRSAPGSPGAPPRWNVGRKEAVGTSRSETSLVWFTLAQGVWNEIFFPRIDSPCTREGSLFVTAKEFFSDESVDAKQELTWLGEGVPGFRVVTHCESGRYRLEKVFITDDRLNCALQKVNFIAEKGRLEDYRLYFHINPHVGGRGASNTAWIESYKGRSTLFAKREDLALAVACSNGFAATSVGFVDSSDGLKDLREGAAPQDFRTAAEVVFYAAWAGA